MAKKKKKNSDKTVRQKPAEKMVKKKLTDNSKNLKPFIKGDPRINRKGRPRILLSQFNEELIKNGVEPVTPSQIDQTYKLFFNLTVDEIKAIAMDEKKGILLRTTAKSLLSPAGQKMLEDMMNRSMGMAKQITEGNMNIIQHKLPDMTGWSYQQTVKFIESGELPKILAGNPDQTG